ncbi:MAG: hypothetical protein HYX72_13720 [Acidobacteria bacterium]|nr:hypothetical protein [Acidobacteriota bacterium]
MTHSKHNLLPTNFLLNAKPSAVVGTVESYLSRGVTLNQNPRLKMAGRVSRHTDGRALNLNKYSRQTVNRIPPQKCCQTSADSQPWNTSKCVLHVLNFSNPGGLERLNADRSHAGNGNSPDSDTEGSDAEHIEHCAIYADIMYGGNKLFVLNKVVIAELAVIEDWFTIMLAGLAARGALHAQAFAFRANRFENGASCWEFDPGARGLFIEQEFGGNLPSGFPTVDRWVAETGEATSIKSIDLTAASYQQTCALMRKLKRYVDDLATFKGRAWGGVRIYERDIKSRILILAIPDIRRTAEQQTVLDEVRAYGAQHSVTVVLRELPWSRGMTQRVSVALYFLDDKAILPTVGRTEAGYDLEIEPVTVLDVNDRRGIIAALAAALSTGNPVIPTPSPRDFPKPVVMRHVSLRSYQQFVEKATTWSILKGDDYYVIVPYLKGNCSGWKEDAEHHIKLPEHGDATEMATEIVNLILAREQKHRDTS